MEILNNYLYQHKSISIPGLGTLHMDRMPARTDFVNRQILAPYFSFRFDQYFDAPDKDFFGYLANKKQIQDFEAIKWFNEFSFDLRTRIRNKEEVSWPGLGSFHAGESGEIYFKSDPAMGPKVQPVIAERIIRNNAGHSVLVGDKERSSAEMPDLLTETYIERESWWIYAIIITAIALSICAYQIFSNKSHYSNFGSQQNVPVKTSEPTSR